MATVKGPREAVRTPASELPQNDKKVDVNAVTNGSERSTLNDNDNYSGEAQLGARLGALPSQTGTAAKASPTKKPQRGLSRSESGEQPGGGPPGGWPRALFAEEKDALNALVKTAPQHGAPTINDLLKAPAFVALPMNEKAGLLKAIAALANSGKDPREAISSAAITAAVLSPTADAHDNARTLHLALAVKPADLDTFLFAHQSGKLQERDAVTGKSVLDALMPLTDAQLVAADIDRSALIGQILKDVQNPIAIHQGKRNTCGATSCSILLARTRPVEYARILTELGGSSGRATLPDGKSTILVKRDALTDDSNRTLTGRLLQPALMEFADGGASYDNRTEVHTRGLPKNIPGLTQPEVARLATALFPQKHRSYGADMSVDNVVEAIIPGNKPFEPSALISLVEGKKPAFALLDVDKGTFHIPAKGFHWVLVHDIKDGRVYFDDPNRVTNAQIANQSRTRPGDYRVESDGRASMPVNDFARVLWTMVAHE